MWSTITPDGTLWRMCKILRVQRNPLSPHHGERGMVQKHSPITSWSRLCQTSEQRGAKKRSLLPEVRSIIKSLKVKKLSGVDDITNKMIKRLRDRAVINAVLRPAEVEDYRRHPLPVSGRGLGASSKLSSDQLTSLFGENS
jgi:hypothetical protein